MHIHPSAALNNRKAQGGAIQFAPHFALHQLLKTNLKLEPQQWSWTGLAAETSPHWVDKHHGSKPAVNAAPLALCPYTFYSQGCVSSLLTPCQHFFLNAAAGNKQFSS